MASVVTVLGFILEALLLWRLLSWRAWRAYPLFNLYFASLLARLILLEVVRLNYGLDSSQFARWYWYTNPVHDVLKLLVAWEVYHRMFRRGTTANRVARLLFGGTLLILALLCIAAGVRGAAFYVDVGINFGFSVAVLMVGALATARYYGHALNRNLWGIALGMGLFAAASVMNFSALGINERMYPIFRHARPILFNFTLAIWVVTLWFQAPTTQSLPSVTPDSNPVLTSAPSLWNRVRQTLEKALRVREHH